jgi:hypothetical protein
LTGFGLMVSRESVYTALVRDQAVDSYIVDRKGNYSASCGLFGIWLVQFDRLGLGLA